MILLPHSRGKIERVIVSGMLMDPTGMIAITPGTPLLMKRIRMWGFPPIKYCVRHIAFTASILV